MANLRRDPLPLKIMGHVTADSRIDRRKLLRLLTGGLAAAIAGTVAAIFGRYLAGSASAQELEGTAPVSLGKLADWPAGRDPVQQTVSFLERDGYSRETRRERVFLVRGGSAAAVFSATCTHLGCSVSWDAGSRTFRCPCHGGVYGIDGRVVSGPPPRPLRRLPIEVRNGEVFVHPSELA